MQKVTYVTSNQHTTTVFTQPALGGLIIKASIIWLFSAQKREGSGELRIQAMSYHTVQCGPITLQYSVI